MRIERHVDLSNLNESLSKQGDKSIGGVNIVQEEGKTVFYATILDEPTIKISTSPAPTPSTVETFQKN